MQLFWGEVKQSFGIFPSHFWKFLLFPLVITCGPLETLRVPDSKNYKRLDIAKAVWRLANSKFHRRMNFFCWFSRIIPDTKKANQDPHLVCQIQTSSANANAKLWCLIWQHIFFKTPCKSSLVLLQQNNLVVVAEFAVDLLFHHKVSNVTTNCYC